MNPAFSHPQLTLLVESQLGKSQMMMMWSWNIATVINALQLPRAQIVIKWLWGDTAMVIGSGLIVSHFFSAIITSNAHNFFKYLYKRLTFISVNEHVFTMGSHDHHLQASWGASGDQSQRGKPDLLNFIYFYLAFGIYRGHAIIIIQHLLNNYGKERRS